MNYTDKQVEAVARRLGYTGPMHKFGEFLRASPKVRLMAEGGMVQNTTAQPINTGPASITADQVTQAGMSSQDFQNLVQLYSQPNTPTPTVAPTQVSTLQTNQNQFIPTGSGQLTGPAPQVTAAQGQAATVGAAPQTQAQTVEAFLTQPGVNALTNNLTAAQGTVSEQSTVRGQMAGLMEEFEGGNTPAWAAGALRNADAAMAARGLGASSMAGAARTQAAMEAALPIAAQDAQTFFAMQQQNLNNEQQVAIQRNQARIDSFFTDAAQINATRQFNATSVQQTQQFNASLRTQVQQFNAAQVNAMRQFNVGQRNQIGMFRAEMRNQRQQFNAANRLIIDQANATWRQQIATVNNANINEANRQDAQNAFNMTLAQMNNMFQGRRDAISFAYNSSQSAQDRAMALLLASMESDEAERSRSAESRNGLWSALGNFAAQWFR